MPDADRLHDLLDEARSWLIPDCAHSTELAREAIRIAQALGDRVSETEGLICVATSMWALGQNDDGLAALQAAERLTRSTQRDDQHAEVDTIRGKIHMTTGDYPAALKAFVAALKHALSCHRPRVFVDALLGVGNLLSAHGQYGEALRWNEMALEFAGNSGDTEAEAEAYVHTLANYNELGEFELALAVAERGEAVLRRSQHRSWLADWFCYRAHALLQTDRAKAALESLDDAWQINLENGYLWSQTLNLLMLAEAHLELRQFPSCRNHLDEAATRLKAFQAPTLLMRLHDCYARLGKASGDFRLAWQHTREHHQKTVENTRALALTRLTAALDRRIAELDRQLLLLHAREENQLLRERSAAVSELLETLQTETRQDPLTGAANRRHLDQELPLLAERCRHDHRPLAVLMIDLDHFKSVNDRFGHAVGDTVLKLAVGIMDRACRSGDVIARYGGEEFSVILPGATMETARMVAERVLAGFREFNWPVLASDLRQTASIGVAELDDSETATSLLARADAALYRAKAAGRNQLEVAE
ncbi:diguanylate cyclase [Chitinibacteraceae bacterium HSL-7]